MKTKAFIIGTMPGAPQSELVRMEHFETLTEAEEFVKKDPARGWQVEIDYDWHCMNKAFKIITDIAMEEYDAICTGYEMVCLISEEFTPAPKFDSVVQKVEQLITKYGYSMRDFNKWLKNRYRKWSDPKGGVPVELDLYLTIMENRLVEIRDKQEKQVS